MDKIRFELPFRLSLVIDPFLISYNLTFPSSDPTAIVAPRIQTEPIESLASSRICIGYRLEEALMSHNLTLRSSDPVAKTLESSLKASELIFKWWPWNCLMIRPLTESQ